MVDWASIALIIIALAWLVQLILSWNSKKIQPVFIALYMLGVLILVASGYLASASVSPYEIFTFIAAFIVLIRVISLKK